MQQETSLISDQVRNIPAFISLHLNEIGITSPWAAPVSFLLLFGLVLVLCYLVDKIAQRALAATISHFIQKTRTTWDDSLVARKVPQRVAHLAPALVLYLSADLLFTDFPILQILVQRLSLCLLLLIGALITTGVVDVLTDWSSKIPATKDKPIKSYGQVIKLILYILVFISIVSVLINRSPLVLLSGLGAMTAIILLVFKDSIMGFVASIQISAYDMIRVGDWIEFQKYGADGDVIDISLNVIKVQNWDKTITTIPTYAFMAESFKNWRGMTKSGGRRIKRSVFIDAQTVKFLDEPLLKHLNSVQLLDDYLTKKEEELAEHNTAHGGEFSNLINGRRLTNIGTFRAYVERYLKSLPDIHLGMTLLVRQLQSTDRGIPIEIYAFSKDTNWKNYEGM
ncbi:UNVERIFIED_CONTAM: hypothetical protein GTU68_066651, partial [Idotea baltica]|nr:hypothetical protein [Idotea baltica]